MSSVVLFDWNGTIVDDKQRAVAASNEIRTHWGLPPLSEQDWAETWCLPLTEHATRLGVPATAAAAAVDIWNDAVADRDAELSLGADALLHALQDLAVPAGVITAAGERAIAGDLDRHGLRDLFRWLYTDTVDKAAAIRAHASGSVRLVYVGDSELDMAHGREASALTIGFTGGYCTADQLEAAGADHLVDDLRLVAELLA